MSSFNFFSLGGFLLRKKSEKCIAFLDPSLHCKLALFRVPYALRATFIPSLRFGTGCASPYNPCHCLKLKNSKFNLLFIFLNELTTMLNCFYSAACVS